MILKEKIRIYAALIGSPMLLIAQIFNLAENNLTTKQSVGSYLSILIALLVFVSIIPDLKKNKK